MRAPTPFVNRVFGLRVESDIELPRLGPVNGTESGTIYIHADEVSLDDMHAGQKPGPFSIALKNKLGLEIPEIVRILVKDGSEIIYQPAPGVDLDTVRLFILGSGLGALMIQRGHLVMHANAIKVGDSAVLCTGVSGAGKSTLAAAFMQRGYSVFTDDVCPIDDAGRVLPGAPTIKIWKDAAQKLGISTEGLARVRPELEKFDMPVGDVHSETPLPVRLVVQLVPRSSPGIEVTEITGAYQFRILRNNTYRFRFVGGLEQREMHFRACAQLGQSARLIQVRRPSAVFDLDGLMDTILAEVENGLTSA